MKFLMIKYYVLFILLSSFLTIYGQEYSDEIIFYSNGSTFSPLITTQGDATILWTFNDSTSSPSNNPTKIYGTVGLRLNRLKVTPWSALKGINIGYDAADGGSDSIPLISNQYVSKIENLDLVAPYLELWCSSYNPFDSLNFNNFVNLKTIEIYSSAKLQKVSLKNTPLLKRLCLEDNILKTLDISECTGLEDLRAALNNLTDITFSNSTEELWHICIRDNPDIQNQSLFSNMENFPAVKELYIWNTNQSGKFEIHETSVSSLSIMARDNNYSELDLSGALQNEGGWAGLYFDNNKLNSINLKGCVNFGFLHARYNQLAADSVDKVLQQLDEFGTLYRRIDLRDNSIPTSVGLEYKANLETRNWTVYVQTGSEINVSGSGVNITNGDTTPAKSDLTDFDSVKIGTGGKINTYIIKNNGTTALQLLENKPYVLIVENIAADFKVISEPASIIQVGDSTSFQIAFNPSNVGLYVATISILNDDWDNSPFTFNIQGMGTNPDMTSVVDNSFAPKKFELLQNYPNPFNPSTQISYTLPHKSLVKLIIYDILGNAVATIVNEVKSEGFYSVNYNATGLVSGVYIYKIQAGSFVSTKKMIMMK